MGVVSCAEDGWQIHQKTFNIKWLGKLFGHYELPERLQWGRLSAALKWESTQFFPHLALLVTVSPKTQTGFFLSWNNAQHACQALDFCTYGNSVHGLELEWCALKSSECGVYFFSLSKTRTINHKGRKCWNWSKRFVYLPFWKLYLLLQELSITP